MGLLDGKVAIVTGAGGGLGRCHALLLAQEGAKVVVNDLGVARDGTSAGQPMAEQVAAEIRAAGGEAVANMDSVATMAGGRAIVQAALDAFGRADILVNNAGILRDKTLLKLEEEQWDLVIAVHLKGTFACTQAFAAHVQERANGGDRGGRIINTSSYAGLMGNYGQSNYAAAKAGIYGLTKVWAMELTKLGVTVNCIAPMAKTRMTEDIAMVPDTMRPEQVSPMVLFLASDLAEGVNGRVFGIHGQQLLEYKMVMTDGVTKQGDALWTPAEIQAQLGAIGAEARPAAAAAPAAAARGPAQVIARAFELLPEVFLPERAKGWTARIVFDITDGEPWTVTIDGGKCTTARGKADAPTCVVSVDEETYAKVVTGEEKAEKAFMTGKIKASNLADMMKMGAAFDMKKARELAQREAASAGAPAAPAEPAGADAVIAQAFTRLPEVFLPGRAAGWTARIVFDITDGEPWTVTVADGKCTTARGKADAPTCVVSVDKETYAAVVQGTLRAEKAFMAGKIKASNLADMMKMGSAFDMNKARELAQAQAAAVAAPVAPAAAAAPSGPEQVIDRAFAALPSVFLPERAKGWTARIVFDIQGGTPWTVRVEGGACTTTRGKADDPTCVVTVDKETYAKVLSGEEKAEKAFMMGKIRATNLTDMMKLGAAFDMKKARDLALSAPAAAPAATGGAPAGAAAGDPRAVVARGFEALPSTFKPEQASGWQATFHFDIAGGDPWTVAVEGGACKVTPGLVGAATCVVKTSLEDYAKVLSGELKAETAFMQRRLTATNLTEMMRFGRAFDLRRAAELAQQGAAAAAPPAAAPRKGLNEACLGKLHAGREPTFVRPEHVKLFAAATQDANPRFDPTRADAIAPPMFAVRLLKDVLFATITDEELGADMLNLVHGEQDMEFLRPLRPWDLTATRAHPTAIEDKATGQVLRLEEEVLSGGEVAVRVRASMFIRDPSKRREKGSGEAKAAPKQEAAPEVAFRQQVTVPQDAGPRYAEASLDNNPIHTDPEVANMAGFPGIILQGLCTMTFAAKAVVDEVLAGDPTRLKRLAVRFSRPVLMGDVLTTEGWPLEPEGGRQRYGLRVVNQRGEVVLQNAVAEVE